MEVASQPRLGWRGGLSEVIAQIQRMELSGRGHAQGELEPKPSGERFSERSVTLRVDLPLGRSHFWEDEAGVGPRSNRSPPKRNPHLSACRPEQGIPPLRPRAISLVPRLA